MEELLNSTNNFRNCSYCRSSMHNIRGCNSSNIEILLDCLQQAFAVIRRTNTRTVTKNLYTHWLLHTYNLQQLKVVAVTRMNSRVSGLNKADYADKIWYIINYQHENNEEVEEVEEVGWRIDRLPNANPEITFNTNTINELHTPPTMSPRTEPPEIERRQNDADDELIINSPNRRQVGFGYIPSFLTQRMIRETLTKLDDTECNKNISIKTQELIGLTEILEDDFECSICYETQHKSKRLILSCDHEYCTECIINTLKIDKKNNKTPNCAFCRDEMKEFLLYSNKELEDFEHILIAHYYL